MTITQRTPRLTGVTSATTLYTGTTGAAIAFKRLNISIPNGEAGANVTVTNNNGTTTVKLLDNVQIKTATGGATLSLEQLPCGAGDIIQVSSTVAADVCGDIWEYT